MEALLAFERGVCACGFHESLTGDPTNHFTFEDKKCPVCAGSAQYARIQHARDEAWSKARNENSPAGMPRPGDGRHTYTRLMTPTEVAGAATTT